jgi:hypothetical protein
LKGLPATTVTDPPLVSIGVPVHNAERYLRQALDSLIGQDYPNLEVIISDNASDDSTRQICLEFAQRDSRVAYHPVDKNMGAIWNFNRVFELARGKYFMWAAFDDIRDVRYVSACVAALEDRPDAVMCSTGFRFIDERGQRMDVAASAYGVRPIGRTARDRLRQVADSQVAYDIYGLARRTNLAQVRKSVLTWGFDFVILLELCLQGPVLVVPEALFFYRLFQVKTQPGVASLLAGSEAQNRVPVCWSCMTLELLRSIWLAPMGWVKKVLFSADFMLHFCLLNVAVAAGIRLDVTRTMRRALSQRAWGRLAVLLAIGALVYPVHNRVARGLYRLSKRILGGVPRPAATPPPTYLDPSTRDAGKTYVEQSETGS